MNRIKSFIFLMIMASNSAYAKWAKFEEAAISTELVQKIQIKKNGSSEELIEVQWEILKESARNFASNFHLNYNGDSSKIKILEAKTIYKGKVYSVDPNFLEDKPLASAPQGFDQIRQVMIAFPNIEIGAKIYVKYKYTFSKVPLDNYYSGRLEFGRREWLKKSHVTLTSEIPLSILVNDPSDSLEIKKDKSDGLHRLEVVLKKPIYKDTINEPELGLIDERLFTWISLSSINNWRELAIKFALQNYAQVFTQPLPPYFGEILKKATEKKNDIDQINTITSSLDEKIRYMGDWRSINGRFMPRELAKISETQIGDCKDFAASAAAIFTKLGFKAQIAAVSRGVMNLDYQGLPSPYAFNHVIVKVTNKDHKVYWIDPTNFESMAGRIFPDISDRMALILDPQEPSYERIPPVEPLQNHVSLSREIKILPRSRVFEKGLLTLNHQAALGFTGAGLNLSEEAIKDQILDKLSDSNLDDSNKKWLVLPDLRSRVVKDLSFSYSYEQQNKTFTTNLGLALKLSYKRLDSFIYTSQDDVSDLFIDIPSSLKRITLIKDKEVKNIEKLNVEIKTPWLYASRICKWDKKDLHMEDDVIIYQSVIRREEINSPEFAKMKDDIEKNFKDVSIIFSE